MLGSHPPFQRGSALSKWPASILGAALICLAFSPPRGNELFRIGIESLLNTSARDFFAGTLKLRKASLSNDFKLKLENLHGEITTTEKPITLSIDSIVAKNPLYRLLLLQPVEFYFRGLKPAGSLQPGLMGTLHFQPGWHWRIKVETTLESLGLEEIIWINPASLAGSSGQLQGHLVLSQTAMGQSEFTMDLLLPEPGGKLPARFFDAVTPYLPRKKNKRQAETLANGRDLVTYSHAALEARLESADTLRAVFRILIPEYNLNLNLKMMIKLDEKNAFMKLFQLLGLLQAKAT